MAHNTGKAVKLRHVPQKSTNAVVSGFFQLGPLLELLISIHQRENRAPIPKGPAIEAAINRIKNRPIKKLVNSKEQEIFFF